MVLKTAFVHLCVFIYLLTNVFTDSKNISTRSHSRFIIYKVIISSNKKFEIETVKHRRAAAIPPACHMLLRKGMVDSLQVV